MTITRRLPIVLVGGHRPHLPPSTSWRRWGLFRGRREGRKLLDAPPSLEVASRRSWEASEEDLNSGRVAIEGRLAVRRGGRDVRSTEPCGVPVDLPHREMLQ